MGKAKPPGHSGSLYRQEDKSQFWQAGLFEPGWQEIVMLFYDTGIEAYRRDPSVPLGTSGYFLPNFNYKLKDTGNKWTQATNKTPETRINSISLDHSDMSPTAAEVIAKSENLKWIV